MRVLANLLGYRSNITRDLAKGALTALLVMGAGKLLKYLMQVLLARWMGPQDYGEFSAVFALTQVLAIFAVLGLSTSSLKYIPQYSAEQAWGKLRGFARRARQYTMGAAVVLATSLIGVSWALAQQSELSAPLRLGAFLIPLLALMDLHTDMLRALGRMGLAYIPGSLLYPLAVILVGGLLYVTLGGLTVNLVLVVVGAALVLVLGTQMTGWVLSMVPEVLRVEHMIFEDRTWIRTSLPMLVVSASGVVMTQTDIFLVGILAGPVQAGLFAAASKTASLISFALVGISAMAAPMLSASFARGDRRGLEQILQRATLWGSALSLGTGLLLVVLSPAVLSSFGPEFIQGRPAFLVLAVGQAVNAIAGPVGILLLLTGHQNATGLVYAASATGNVVLNMIAIPLWGLMGAAVVSVFTIAVWNACFVLLAKSRLGLGPFIFLRVPE